MVDWWREAANQEAAQPKGRRGQTKLEREKFFMFDISKGNRLSVLPIISRREGPTKLEREILYKIHIFYWTKILGFANISVHPNERGLREILFSFS